MKVMKNNYYRLSLEDRRRLLADAGFARDEYRIWSHPDGRALGEGVAIALTDAALLRYLGLDLPAFLKTNAKKRRTRTKRKGK
jgi:hypothetical protein